MREESHREKEQRLRDQERGQRLGVRRDAGGQRSSKRYKGYKLGEALGDLKGVKAEPGWFLEHRYWVAGVCAALRGAEAGQSISLVSVRWELELEDRQTAQSKRGRGQRASPSRDGAGTGLRVRPRGGQGWGWAWTRGHRVSLSPRSLRTPGGTWAARASPPSRRSLALADDAAFRERARMLAALERRRWLSSYIHRLLVLDAR